jgi:hypothetical protein
MSANGWDVAVRRIWPRWRTVALDDRAGLCLERFQDDAADPDPRSRKLPAPVHGSMSIPTQRKSCPPVPQLSGRRAPKRECASTRLHAKVPDPERDPDRMMSPPDRPDDMAGADRARLQCEDLSVSRSSASRRDHYPYLCALPAWAAAQLGYTGAVAPGRAICLTTGCQRGAKIGHVQRSRRTTAAGWAPGYAFRTLALAHCPLVVP